MLTQGQANVELLFLPCERYLCGRSLFLPHPAAVPLNTIFSEERLSVQDRKTVAVSYCFKFTESRGRRRLPCDPVRGKKATEQPVARSPPALCSGAICQQR